MVGAKPSKIGDRCLVLDFETSADYAQAALFGFVQVRQGDDLALEILVRANDLPAPAKRCIASFAKQHNLMVVSCEEFIDGFFYPEVYQLGTLCIGYNLPFDLTRIAERAGLGRIHRSAFNMKLSSNGYWPRLRLEAISSRAAFIGFAPVKRNYPDMFFGRFLDCRALVNALTGESMSLRRAGELFEADVLKGVIETYGTVDKAALIYCRDDVAATWALYCKLRQECERFSFTTFENELVQSGQH